jgi:serine/threonine protein kinase
MAPEVVNRKGHSFAADWWSFGVLMVGIFFQLLVNHFGLSVRHHESAETLLKALLTTI